MLKTSKICTCGGKCKGVIENKDTKYTELPEEVWNCLTCGATDENSKNVELDLEVLSASDFSN